MKKIVSNTKVQQNKEIDASDLNGDKVMMNLEKGMYFALNGVGSRIWDIIEEEKSVDHIVDVLTSEYKVNREQCEDSVITFLEGLESDELITVL
ncbi:lasso peptide biosynthesis PqqD family chaperone [Clostridium sp.]